MTKRYSGQQMNYVTQWTVIGALPAIGVPTPVRNMVCPCILHCYYIYFRPLSYAFTKVGTIIMYLKGASYSRTFGDGQGAHYYILHPTNSEAWHWQRVVEPVNVWERSA